MIVNKRELDATEFNMLAHTLIIADMITNRVQVPNREIGALGLSALRDMLEEISIGMFHIRSNGIDTFIYFTEFEDRQQFMTKLSQYFSDHT
jgi:hypothetical protein